MTQCVVRAGLLDETSHFYAFDGIEPSTLQASLFFTVDPSLSFESADEPDSWRTEAKLKLKVDVVSVTGKKHTEDRLQDIQPMLDLS